MIEITTQNLRVLYAGKRENVVALSDFSATFPSGEFCVILGYSGCGKTTLLKSIAGVLECNGAIFFNGENVTDYSADKRNVAFVSQDYVLYPNMTVFDNIAFPLKLMKVPKEEIRARVKEIAEKLDIFYCLTRKPKQISGGQQQRTAIARALVKRPDVILFDEPFSNLDASLRGEMRSLVKQATQSMNMTTLFVTHDFSEAMSLADRIYIVNDGKLEISGTKEEIYKSNNQVVNSLRSEVELSGVFKE